MPGLFTRLAISAAIIGAVLLFQPRRDDPDVTVSAGLNLREGPDTRARKVAVLPVGVQVEVVTCLADRSWCRVRHQNQSGWASAAYLTAATQEGRIRMADSGDALRVQVEPGSSH